MTGSRKSKALVTAVKVVFAMAVVIVTGCGERHLRISMFHEARPTGVGLRSEVHFSLVECDGPAPDDVALDAYRNCVGAVRRDPRAFLVEAGAGHVRVLETVLKDGKPGGPHSIEARIEAMSEGTERIVVHINDIGPAEFELGVEPVRTSLVFANDLLFLDPSFLAEHDTVERKRVFTGSSVSVGQAHYSSEAVAGEEPSLDAYLDGYTEIWVDEGNETRSLGSGNYYTGLPGTAEAYTDLGGLLELEIVGRSAIASAEIREGTDFRPLGDSVTLELGKIYNFAAVPFDASGQFILGDGEEPVSETQGDVIEVGGRVGGAGLLYFVEAKNKGATTLEFRWGDVRASLPVVVE